MSDMTIKEAGELLKRCGGKLVLREEHGVYHAYVLRPETGQMLASYDRGDLSEAVEGAVLEAARKAS